MSTGRSAYIRRETMISMVINAALSAAFCVLVFGRSASIAVWGVGGFAVDFVPQSFMIGLMGALVPGLLARRATARVAAGVAGPAPSAGAVVLTAVVLAIGSAAIGGGVAAAALVALGATSLAFSTGLAIKIAYGATLARIVTPIALRRVLA